MSKEEKYISLKEAAKMSGYSADYVGQLIRSGKLSGKQVFSNVSWVTTEDAILDYLRSEKKGVMSGAAATSLKDVAFTSEGLEKVYSIVAWAVIGILGAFILLLVSVFAISLDHTASQKYQQEAANKSSQ